MSGRGIALIADAVLLVGLWPRDVRMVTIA